MPKQWRGLGFPSLSSNSDLLLVGDACRVTVARAFRPSANQTYARVASMAMEKTARDQQK